MVKVIFTSIWFSFVVCALLVLGIIKFVFWVIDVVEDGINEQENDDDD